MKKKQTIVLSFFVSLIIVVLLAACASGAVVRREIVYARAFIDFSGYTGPPSVRTHQPPLGSEYTQGAFALDNGITGDGLRISHHGDNALVEFVQHGGKTTLRSGDYLYFFIDNYNVRNAHTITMAITFFDDAPGSFMLQYVSMTNNFTPVSIPKGGTGVFVTATVQLDDCNFTSGHNQGAQFRFGRGAIIQRVDIVTGGKPDPRLDPPPPFAPSTALNDMLGKGITGYQAWFNAPGNNWHHWSHSGIPGPGNVNVEIWPAGWEYYLANGAVLHDTNFFMPDGTRAQVFNSHDQAVIRTHFQWMRDAGIDGVAVQRFFVNTSPVDTGDAPNHLTRIRDAAEETGRIFYIMYDMSAAGIRQNPDQSAVVRRIQLDWIYNVERKGLLSSPNYAQMEGKPVVCIWGVHAIQSTDNYRYISVEAAIELIHWFRDRGLYVIGGIPDNTFWEEGGNRHPRGREMYSLFDMISPWYVGRDVEGSILGPGQWLVRGLEFARDNPRSWADNRPQAFMPTIWPGFAWTNMVRNAGTPNQVPRNAGQWVWTQVQEYLNRDADNIIQNFYFAMFDEYDEATSWMKAATDFFEIPVGQYFLTNAADGIWLSSDYYMRLASAAVRALQAKIAAGGGSSVQGTPGYTGPLNVFDNPHSIIVEHSLGPIFWRNSFERRTGRLKHGAIGEGGIGIPVPVHHLPIDVGVPHGLIIAAPVNVSVTGPFAVNRPAIGRGARGDRFTPPVTTIGMVYTDNARSGGSVFRLAGDRTAGSGASFIYRIAETRIRVRPGMALTFWQRPENALGENVIVDLQMDNGIFLSNVPGFNLQRLGTPQNGWQRKTVTLPAVLSQQGRYITAVVVAYRDTGTATGSFAAMIDDIEIHTR